MAEAFIESVTQAGNHLQNPLKDPVNCLLSKFRLEEIPITLKLQKLRY
jgi:hypothetical protein